jgi:hypothetical protein
MTQHPPKKSTSQFHTFVGFLFHWLAHPFPNKLLVEFLWQLCSIFPQLQCLFFGCPSHCKYRLPGDWNTRKEEFHEDKALELPNWDPLFYKEAFRVYPNVVVTHGEDLLQE